MILEVDNVELNFSSRTILSGIYLKAETGSVTGILGSNGSGKSCLLQIIFGSLRSKYKLIRVDDIAVIEPLYKSGKSKFLPQFNFVPNTFGIYKAFELFDVDWEGFIEEFKSFARYRQHRMSRLSGGERRVVEIYLTLTSPSKIVLLDEPFSHLSPLFIEKIVNLIQINKKGKVIIMTDHMYRHIFEVSDTLYLLKHGCTKRISNGKELENYGYLSPGVLD